MAVPTLTIVAARARNGVIGLGGRLPWHLRTDLQRFKALTMGKPCIMGRKTWDGLSLKPLPGRLNLVLSSDPEFRPKGALVCNRLDDALDIAREQAGEDGVDEVPIIGGARLWEQALPRVRRLYLTEVEAEPQGDTLFPPFDEADWVETASEAVPAGEKDDFAMVFRTLERR